ncbi:MAG TPA: EamA family transporter [Micromonosporaceae bacterium]|jgi:drug/metabolite transporter (DMT)-like permease
MSKRGWLLFLAMGIIWGTPYLMIKVAVGVLDPWTLVFARCALAALILMPLALRRGQIRPALAKWPWLLAFAAVEITIPWLLLSTAEERLSSSLSGLLLAAVPLVGALLGWLTGGERLGGRRILGLAIGIAGVATLVGLDLSTNDTAALIEMVLVAIGYALGPFILARYLTGVPGLGVLACALTVSALVYAPIGIARMPHSMPKASVVWSVVGLAVLCTAIGFVIFFALIDEVGPVRATVITYINPAVAILLGVLLLGEPMTIGIGVGFVLVLLGSILATRRSTPKDADVEAEEPLAEAVP